jgi:type II secretory pathway predicted ATPase ExeA
MRYFNTSGPCDPDRHYTVMREALVAKGKEMAERGRYFTIFAPRQAGKTTYFQLLLQKLREEHIYTPIWISLEHMKMYSREEFYQGIAVQFKEEFSEYNLELAPSIHNSTELLNFLKDLQPQVQPLIWFIDEFEGIPDCVLSELMHTFRMIYHRKKYYSLHSVVLVGVSTIAELVVSSASPFNVVDELKIPYFTFEEVCDLIQQYVTESEQVFDEPVIKAIYENTQGQPGLVCALCAHLVEKVAIDRSKPVTMDAMYPTLKHFLKERFDKNIQNIVQKAREKQDFMIRLLFADSPIEFTVDRPDIAYLYAHGVIDNVDGYVDIPVPLYRKRLITAFRPLINGEVDHYFSAHDTFGEYITPEGLNMQAILMKYREYVRRRGFKAFDTEHLKEGAWHYSLDGFINFFIERLGGHTFIETPTGRGRTDILILYQNHKYIIETKIFTDNSYFEKGKGQLAEEVNHGRNTFLSNKRRIWILLKFCTISD